MTVQTQASQIVQKHYKIIESHLPIHSMTDSQMMKIAKEHATKEVKGIIESMTYDLDGNAIFPHHSTFKYWASILDEIERI